MRNCAILHPLHLELETAGRNIKGKGQDINIITARTAWELAGLWLADHKG